MSIAMPQKHRPSRGRLLLLALLLPAVLLSAGAQAEEQLAFAAKYQRPPEAVLIASG